ncbi:tricarballylate utilization 4Fe-4S protein TcuB [bacterium]|nr:MAG: tricarballylate utilization 4Fe-4S protein TcuB [bacterium]
MSESKLGEAQRQFDVCNSCRYCESICAVFPAAELRDTFSQGDLAYISNVCHDCRACLDACQYAPPHEFGVNIPKLLAESRVESYERYSRPAAFARMLRSSGWSTATVALAAIAAILAAVAVTIGVSVLITAHQGPGAFYRVVPYVAMVAGGLAAALYGLVISIAGGLAFWKDSGESLRDLLDVRAHGRAIWEAVTLHYTKGGGAGCHYPERAASSLRSTFHQLVFWGFLSDFIATTLAAIYQDFLGIMPPFRVLSIPVMFGIVGGVMLVVGCSGLTVLKVNSDKDLAAAEMTVMDYVFLVLLNLVAISGLALLLFRGTQVMGWLLGIHLGLVGVLFVTAPYGKFVHVVYRYLALVKHRLEVERTS